MPLFGKRERIVVREAQLSFANFTFAPVRWREPCVKIIIIGNLFFATATFVQVALSAALKPSVSVAEGNAAQITGQIKIPCETDQRTLLYGFDFFAVIRNTDIARGIICRDVASGKWIWQFEDSKLSQFNSK